MICGGVKQENKEDGIEISSLEITADVDSVEISAENFPDEAFRTYLSGASIDKDKDGYLSQEEIASVTKISVDGKTAIKDLSGIEIFTNLTQLYCYNTGITSLNVSQNTKLVNLSCYDTAITELDVTNLASLQTLYCYNTGITSLDVSGCTALKWFNCSETGISNLDVSKNTNLTTLKCNDTGITSLDFSNNPKLMTLEISNTKIGTLNLEPNNDLQTLVYEGSPLYALTMGDKSTKARLNRSTNTELDFKIPTETVDLTELLPGIDVSKVTIVSGGTLSGTTLSDYTTGTPVVYTYDYGKTIIQRTMQVTLNITVGEEGVEINETNFPDEEFRAYVTKQFDKNGSGVLTADEIENIKSVNVENKSKIKDLTGIEYFTEITILNCNNTGVASLDVSNNTKLITLKCNNTQVQNLNLENLTSLKTLTCNGTPLETLTLGNNPELTILECGETKIRELDLTDSPKLTKIWCNNTNITELDLSNQSKVTNLNCSNTGVSELDVSNFSDLEWLMCSNTKISSLDLSNNLGLTKLEVANADLQTLDISKNTKLSNVDVSGNLHLYALAVEEPYDTLTLELPKQTEVDLKVPSPTFDIEQMLPGLDASRVTIISGGTLNGTTLNNYEEGTPVVYSYDYGTARQVGEPIPTLNVTLNLTITSVPITGINHIPAITAEDKTLTVGDKFDPLSGVTASDDEDGDITENIEVVENTVNTSKAGTYKVTYEVTDSQGASATKTITVTVKENGKPSTKPDDTSGTTSVKDKNNTSNTANKAAKTADVSQAGMWICMLILSGVMVVILSVRRKRRVR